VQEISFSSENSKGDCELEVIWVNDFNQTFFDLLSDVKDPRKIHDFLFVAAELANASYHQFLVELPKFSENWNWMSVIA